jgi:hypothetical protein
LPVSDCRRAKFFRSNSGKFLNFEIKLTPRADPVIPRQWLKTCSLRHVFRIKSVVVQDFGRIWVPQSDVDFLALKYTVCAVFVENHNPFVLTSIFGCRPWGEIVGSEVEVAPNPAALVDSLRAFPYSAPSAIADLIDNSITAKARNVRVFARWDAGNPSVEIVDDGDGMTRDRLTEALRFAGMGPSSPRESADLGRFGLGLKTASLSQCSRVTVTSVQSNVVSNLGWDVDELRNGDGRWIPTKSSPETIERHRALIGGSSGTVVCWQKLDRLLGPDSLLHNSDDLDSVFEKVVDHLEMVFHRFMSRQFSDGQPQLSIYVNDRLLTPWDPFLDAYPVAEQVRRVEDQNIDLPSGVSSVAGFVLPTEREAASDGCAELWRSAGRGRWNQLQGFYVYRLDRLITQGGYLGLGRIPDEHTKLARIAIELDNNTDNDWLLDVTKSAVTPPARARAQLNRVATVVCSKASDRYRRRDRTFCKTCKKRPCECPRAPKFELVWTCPNLVDERGKFTVNEQHSMIKDFRNGLTDEQAREFHRIIQLISKTVPISFIRGIPATEEKDYVDRFDDRKESVTLVRELIQMAVSSRTAAGEPISAIRQSLLMIEPFSDFPDIVEEIVNDHKPKSAEG